MIVNSCSQNYTELCLAAHHSFVSLVRFFERVGLNHSCASRCRAGCRSCSAEQQRVRSDPNALPDRIMSRAEESRTTQKVHRGQRTPVRA
jgi:hypothetical protein